MKLDNLRRIKIDSFSNNVNSLAGFTKFEKFIAENAIGFMIFLFLFLIIITAIIFFVIKSRSQNLQEKNYLSLKYYKLAELTNELIFEYNYDLDTFFVSTSYSKTFGIPEKITDYLTRIKEKKLDFTDNLDAIELLITNPKEVNNLDILVINQAVPMWYNITAVLIKKEDGRPASLIGKLVDVDSTKRQVEQLTKKTRYDALTSLLNRSAFEADVENLIVSNKRNVLMMLDLDNLKEINDNFGHAKGDELIINTALALTQIMDEDYMIARYGGDEFMVYCYDIEIEEVEKIAKKINELMLRIICKDKQILDSSISIGICYSDNSSTLKVMFEYADEALYKVKNSTKNNFHIHHI